MKRPILVLTVLLCFIGSLESKQTNPPKIPLENTFVDLSAYSSSKDETDSTPFEGACGYTVAEYSIAITRDLELLGFECNTIVYIFGQGVYFVNDRMNRRKSGQFDLWKGSKKKALEFGLKKAFYLKLT